MKYVLTYEGTPDYRAKVAAHFAAHRALWHAYHADGRLLLIGPFTGFLSLVPYVGVPLAIIPPLIAALPVYSQPTMYVVIAMVVTLMHLLALNLLYPKMVGSRVHLNPLAVTIALMFWGTLWGAVGLLLGIPITAAIKAVCDNVDGWKPYAKLLGD